MTFLRAKAYLVRLSNDVTYSVHVMHSLAQLQVLLCLLKITKTAFCDIRLAAGSVGFVDNQRQAWFRLVRSRDSTELDGQNRAGWLEGVFYAKTS